MNDLIKKALKDKIQQTKHHPFLFIGSGFSHRYAGTKNWIDLLKYFCIEFSDDEFKYNFYENQVTDHEIYGKEPKIASLLERDYNNAVFTSEKFFEFKYNNKELIQKSISPFKIAIAQYLKNITYNNNDNEIKLLQKLAKRSVSGIITTNYDKLIENIFKGYPSYIGQSDLIFANISGIGEIYKIHGSVDKPESIVITEEDYRQFEKLSAYLIAKILTIFLEYPIVFLGYSLQDRNIRNILETISNCLSQDKLDILKERFLFIDYADGNNVSEKEFEFKNGKRIIMTKFSTKDFVPVYEAMLEVKSLYSPKVLRRLRKDIYELAQEAEPTSKIKAAGFDSLEEISEDTDIVIGIGTVKNGHLVKTEEIYDDVIRDNHAFNPKLVIEEYLPELLKRNSGGLPMYKYIQQYDGKIYDKLALLQQKYQTIDSFLNKGLRQNKISYRNKIEIVTVENIIKQEGEDAAYKRLIFLEEREFDTYKIKQYLSKLLEKNYPKILKNNSELKRLIRMYDFVKYKNTPAQINQ